MRSDHASDAVEVLGGSGPGLQKLRISIDGTPIHLMYVLDDEHASYAESLVPNLPELPAPGCLTVWLVVPVGFADAARRALVTEGLDPRVGVYEPGPEGVRVTWR